jgi:hypothetical protein
MEGMEMRIVPIANTTLCGPKSGTDIVDGTIDSRTRYSEKPTRTSLDVFAVSGTLIVAMLFMPQLCSAHDTGSGDASPRERDEFTLDVVGPKGVSLVNVHVKLQTEPVLTAGQGYQR